MIQRKIIPLTGAGGASGPGHFVHYQEMTQGKFNPYRQCKCMEGIERALLTHRQHVLPPTLKEKLKQNREDQGTGSGDKYWDSVIEVIDEHYEDKEDGSECEGCGSAHGHV